MGMERIYLDNAATSWPKPESVYSAVETAQRELGAPAGRGAYREAAEVMRIVEQVRGKVARLINAEHHHDVAFTFNGTDSLSTAILGLLRPGDHVVTSVAEHNSVLRPLRHLESHGVAVTYVGTNGQGVVDVDKMAAAVRPETRLVSLIHVSNVTGAIQPVAKLKSMIEATGNTSALFLLDAAQSLGHLPIDVQQIGCDVLTAPGHKALMGPLGTGVLYCNDRAGEAIEPLRFGGTGSDASLNEQPTSRPEKFEAGNLNVPGIVGLGAGIDFLNSQSGEVAHSRWNEQSKRLLGEILGINGVNLQGPLQHDARIGVFSLAFENFDCHDVASILDSNFGIQTRAGLHCAPLLHRQLGTESSHGTVRVSLGLFNTEAQIQSFVNAIRQLAEG
ncbi:MAG: cysteine desulfurase/selenocysteine lyase [Mariniblastus sp.]|jgi:cysteine desulfurase/selenocysteine lyase